MPDRSRGAGLSPPGLRRARPRWPVPAFCGL